MAGVASKREKKRLNLTLTVMMGELDVKYIYTVQCARHQKYYQKRIVMYFYYLQFLIFKNYDYNKFPK